MFEEKKRQPSIHPGRQFQRLNFPTTSDADALDPLRVVRTSTPPPPHIQWPVTYPEQAGEPIYLVSAPHPQAHISLERLKPEGKRLLDYAMEAAFPSNNAPSFPQLPDTPPPAPIIMPDEDKAPPETPSFSQQATSEAAERWRRSWRERQRAEAAPALDVPRGQASVPSPLSQRESMLRLRAVRLSRTKEER